MNQFLTALLLLPSVALATGLRSESGEVEFLAVGKPSMLKIHGKAENPEAHLSVNGGDLNGSVSMEMEKFSTGIGLRDKHMKEKYLETAAHPKARLTLKNAKVGSGFAESLTNPAEAFEGILSFHGQDRPVKGSFSVEAGKMSAKFPLPLTDFGVEIPTYLGVTVAETVDVSVNLALVKE